MGFVEGLALTVAALILLETVVFLLVPGQFVKIGRLMVRWRTSLMVGYMLLGVGLLYGLLRYFTLVEVMACGIVIAIFYGVALVPYFGAIVDAFEEDLESGELWSRLAPGLLIWVGLAIGVILEWSV